MNWIKINKIIVLIKIRELIFIIAVLNLQKKKNKEGN